MEKERNFKQFIDGLLGVGRKILRKQANQPLTERSISNISKEDVNRLAFRTILKEQLQNFGENDGIVGIEHITNLVGAMAKLPPSDTFMGYPFSQLKGDLQKEILTTQEVREATIKWLSTVHEDLISRHQSLQRETEEREEELDQPDLELRGLTAETGREIKASENAIKLLGGTYELPQA